MSCVCECGFEILLIPDLDEMARSIEEHAETHGKKEPDPEKAKAEHKRIEEVLVKKVLLSIGNLV